MLCFVDRRRVVELVDRSDQLTGERSLWKGGAEGRSLYGQVAFRLHINPQCCIYTTFFPRLSTPQDKKRDCARLQSPFRGVVLRLGGVCGHPLGRFHGFPQVPHALLQVLSCLPLVGGTPQVLQRREATVSHEDVVATRAGPDRIDALDATEVVVGRVVDLWVN